MVTKSSAGKIILAVFVLAVPVLLLYQWWSPLDKAQKRELSLKVRSRIPDGGPFASARNKSRLINPIAVQPPELSASTAAVADSSSLEPMPASSPSLAADTETLPSSSPQAAADTGASPAASAQVAEGATTLPTPSLLAVPVPTPAAPADSAPASTPYSAPAETPIAASASIIQRFASWRDPTLSPYDMLRLQRIEMENNLRQKALLSALENAKHNARKKKRDALLNIHLQGVISNAKGSNRAIVNGQSVREGQTVGGVKVLRITQEGVVFGYKGKKFSRTISR